MELYLIQHFLIRPELCPLQQLQLGVIEIFSKRQRITLRLLYAMSRPSVVCLSVCDVGAPYSGG